MYLILFNKQLIINKFWYNKFLYISFLRGFRDVIYNFIFLFLISLVYILGFKGSNNLSKFTFLVDSARIYNIYRADNLFNKSLDLIIY